MALLGLNTLDWAASGLLVRGWVFYPLSMADQYS